MSQRTAGRETTARTSFPMNSRAGAFEKIPPPTPDRRPDAPATALPTVESESRHVTAKNALRAATCRRGAGGDRGKEQLPQRDPANRSPTTRSHPPATMLYKRARGHQSEDGRDPRRQRSVQRAGESHGE